MGKEVDIDTKLKIVKIGLGKKEMIKYKTTVIKL